MQYQIKKPVMSTGYKTRQRGFEPPTPWSVAKCSVQLSYQRILQISTLPIHNIVFKFQKHHLSDVSKCRRPESNRYGKLIPRDFKSRASANSATPACAPIGNIAILPHHTLPVNTLLQKIICIFRPHLLIFCTFILNLHRMTVDFFA